MDFYAIISIKGKIFTVIIIFNKSKYIIIFLILVLHIITQEK